MVQGPLPVSATFNAPSDAPATLILSGSVWSPSANQLIGVELELDGTVIGKALIFSNTPTTHRTLIPIYVPATLTFGQHKLSLVPLNSYTTTDQNDFFNVVLDY